MADASRPSSRAPAVTSRPASCAAVPPELSGAQADVLFQLLLMQMEQQTAEEGAQQQQGGEEEADMDAAGEAQDEVDALPSSRTSPLTPHRRPSAIAQPGSPLQQHGACIASAPPSSPLSGDVPLTSESPSRSPRLLRRPAALSSLDSPLSPSAPLLPCTPTERMAPRVVPDTPVITLGKKADAEVRSHEKNIRLLTSCRVKRAIAAANDPRTLVTPHLPSSLPSHMILAGSRKLYPESIESKMHRTELGLRDTIDTTIHSTRETRAKERLKEMKREAARKRRGKRRGEAAGQGEDSEEEEAQLEHGGVSERVAASVQAHPYFAATPAQSATPLVDALLSSTYFASRFAHRFEDATLTTAQQEVLKKCRTMEHHKRTTRRILQERNHHPVKSRLGDGNQSVIINPSTLTAPLPGRDVRHSLDRAYRFNGEESDESDADELGQLQTGIVADEPEMDEFQERMIQKSREYNVSESLPVLSTTAILKPRSMRGATSARALPQQQHGSRPSTSPDGPIAGSTALARTSTRPTTSDASSLSARPSSSSSSSHPNPPALRHLIAKSHAIPQPQEKQNVDMHLELANLHSFVTKQERIQRGHKFLLEEQKEIEAEIRRDQAQAQNNQHHAHASSSSLRGSTIGKTSFIFREAHPVPFIGSGGAYHDLRSSLQGGREEGRERMRESKPTLEGLEEKMLPRENARGEEGKSKHLILTGSSSSAPSSSRKPYDSTSPFYAELANWMVRHGKLRKQTVDLEQIQRCAQMFALLDENADGTVEVREMQSALKELGMQVDLSHLKLRTREFDPDKDGRISFEEFLHGVSSIATWESHLGELLHERAMFQAREDTLRREAVLWETIEQRERVKKKILEERAEEERRKQERKRVEKERQRAAQRARQAEEERKRAEMQRKAEDEAKEQQIAQAQMVGTSSSSVASLARYGQSGTTSSTASIQLQRDASAAMMTTKEETTREGSDAAGRHIPQKPSLAFSDTSVTSQNVEAARLSVPANLHLRVESTMGGAEVTKPTAVVVEQVKPAAAPVFLTEALPANAASTAAAPAASATAPSAAPAASLPLPLPAVGIASHLSLSERQAIANLRARSQQRNVAAEERFLALMKERVEAQVITAAESTKAYEKALQRKRKKATRRALPESVVEMLHLPPSKPKEAKSSTAKGGKPAASEPSPTSDASSSQPAPSKPTPVHSSSGSHNVPFFLWTAAFQRHSKLSSLIAEHHADQQADVRQQQLELEAHARELTERFAREQEAQAQAIERGTFVLTTSALNSPKHASRGLRGEEMTTGVDDSSTRGNAVSGHAIEPKTAIPLLMPSPRLTPIDSSDEDAETSPPLVDTIKDSPSFTFKTDTSSSSASKEATPIQHHRYLSFDDMTRGANALGGGSVVGGRLEKKFNGATQTARGQGKANIASAATGSRQTQSRAIARARAIATHAIVLTPRSLTNATTSAKFALALTATGGAEKKRFVPVQSSAAPERQQTDRSARKTHESEGGKPADVTTGVTSPRTWTSQLHPSRGLTRSSLASALSSAESRLASALPPAGTRLLVLPMVEVLSATLTEGEVEQMVGGGEEGDEKRINEETQKPDSSSEEKLSLFLPSSPSGKRGSKDKEKRASTESKRSSTEKSDTASTTSTIPPFTPSKSSAPSVPPPPPALPVVSTTSSQLRAAKRATRTISIAHGGNVKIVDLSTTSAFNAPMPPSSTALRRGDSSEMGSSSSVGAARSIVPMQTSNGKIILPVFSKLSSAAALEKRASSAQHRAAESFSSSSSAFQAGGPFSPTSPPRKHATLSIGRRALLGDHSATSTPRHARQESGSLLPKSPRHSRHQSGSLRTPTHARRDSRSQSPRPASHRDDAVEEEGDSGSGSGTSSSGRRSVEPYWGLKVPSPAGRRAPHSRKSSLAVPNSPFSPFSFDDSSSYDNVSFHIDPSLQASSRTLQPAHARTVSRVAPDALPTQMTRVQQLEAEARKLHRIPASATLGSASPSTPSSAAPALQLSSSLVRSHQRNLSGLFRRVMDAPAIGELDVTKMHGGGGPEGGTGVTRITEEESSKGNPSARVARPSTAGSGADTPIGEHSNAEWHQSQSTSSDMPCHPRTDSPFHFGIQDKPDPHAHLRRPSLSGGLRDRPEPPPRQQQHRPSSRARSPSRSPTFVGGSDSPEPASPPQAFRLSLKRHSIAGGGSPGESPEPVSPPQTTLRLPLRRPSMPESPFPSSSSSSAAGSGGAISPRPPAQDRSGAAAGAGGWGMPRGAGGGRSYRSSSRAAAPSVSIIEADASVSVDAHGLRASIHPIDVARVRDPRSVPTDTSPSAHTGSSFYDSPVSGSPQTDSPPRTPGDEAAGRKVLEVHQHTFHPEEEDSPFAAPASAGARVENGTDEKESARGDSSPDKSTASLSSSAASTSPATPNVIQRRLLLQVSNSTTTTSQLRLANPATFRIRTNGATAPAAVGEAAPESPNDGPLSLEVSEC